jgi:hypothetical protein
VPGVGCVTGEETGIGAEDLTAAFSTEELLGDIDEATLVSDDETVNGIPVLHYRFDESNLTGRDLSELQGDVYVSKEDNYVVRLVAEGTGPLDIFGEERSSNLSLEMNVSDVNEPITIEPPAACDEVGQEFPVLEGATELGSFAGLTSYQVEAALEDVIAFYEDEMPALGYELDDDSVVTEDTAILTFSAEDLPPVTVTISEEEGGLTSVLITREPEGE